MLWEGQDAMLREGFVEHVWLLQFHRRWKWCRIRKLRGLREIWIVQMANMSNVTFWGITITLVLMASPRVSIFIIPLFLPGFEERGTRGSRRMMNVVWTIKMDGTRGTARVDIGSCSNRAQASRRKTNGANALNVVTDIFANKDVSKRVALRLFVGVEEGGIAIRFEFPSS
jgi:hypothetical protein